MRSCQDVVHLYRLLWVSTVLNVLGLCLGITTAAVLGAFKDMVSGVFLCFQPVSRSPEFRAFPFRRAQ